MGTGIERGVRDLARRRGLRLVKDRRGAAGYYVLDAVRDAIISGQTSVDLDRARALILEYELRGGVS